jgi:hypothetical protein
VGAAEFDEGEEDGAYVPAFFRQGILDAGGKFAMVYARDKPIGFEALEAIGEHVRGHSGAIFEYIRIPVEAGHEVS